VALWVVLDPISTIPLFLALTPGMEAGRRRAIATKAALVSGIVLLFFIVAGQMLLQALKIPLYSFQIAGGIVLFLFALTMIFGHAKPQPTGQETAESDNALAVHPLAIPGIAGPGAMLAVVLLTDKDRYSFGEQIDTVGMLLAILLVLWVGLMFANLIARVIGASGASVLARVMGLLLAAVAADNVLKAVKIYVSTATGGG
jgi:multiple antibiotic resistance protein